MDASNLPKGQSAERTDGRPINEPGVYIHKDTKAEFVTAPGEEGVIQADALMAPIWKDAWYRATDLPTREQLLKIRKAQELKDAKAEAKKKAEEKAETEALAEAL